MEIVIGTIFAILFLGFFVTCDDPYWKGKKNFESSKIFAINNIGFFSIMSWLFTVSLFMSLAN